ncbi:MAG: hypothetical protein ABGW98_10255 [Myxococcales bacterium]
MEPDSCVRDTKSTFAWQGLKSLFAMVLGLAAYVAWKFWHRYRVLRSLRIARMLPKEL